MKTQKNLQQFVKRNQQALLFLGIGLFSFFAGTQISATAPAPGVALKCNGSRAITLWNADKQPVAFLPCGTRVSVLSTSGNTAAIQISNLHGLVAVQAIAEVEK